MVNQDNLIDMKTGEPIKKTRPERSIYTQAILDMLIDTQPEEVVSDAAMSQKIGMSCTPYPRGEGYDYVRAAIKIAQRDYAIIMDRVKLTGYKHTPKEDAGISIVMDAKKAYKNANKAIKGRTSAIAAEYDSLSSQAKTNVVITRTLSAFYDQTLKPKTIKKLENSAQKQDVMVLPYADTVELFR
jgi:hypothetical protein